MSDKPQHDAGIFQSLADEAMLGFVMFERPNYNCIYLNKMARQLLEVDSEPKHSTLKLQALFAQESQSRGDYRIFRKELIEHEGLYQDVMVNKCNGHSFIANVGVKFLVVNNQQHILLMIQDMTVQKKLQREVTSKQLAIKNAYEELLVQNRQLKELDLAKDRFIALTTHELRTPLSAMISSAEILKLGLFDDPQQMHEFIDMIYDQGLHLQELVNDILDFAKIQAGRMDFYIEEHKAAELLNSLIENLESFAESNHVKIDLESLPSSLVCYFDDIRLRQVLSNILNNAVKYNVDDGTVKVWADEDNKEVRIFVKDSGKGIPKDQQANVFNEFETLGQVALHHKGTGLGMPISKRLMEGMGGQIHLQSEPGHGSTFWISIPKTRVLDDEVYRPRPNFGEVSVLRRSA